MAWLLSDCRGEVGTSTNVYYEVHIHTVLTCEMTQPHLQTDNFPLGAEVGN